MQSGTTGINTIRIYSPIKNSEDHDPEACLLKKWLPELADIPVNLIHEPWKLNPIEQQFYNCEIGKTIRNRLSISKKRENMQAILCGVFVRKTK
jgi:deoxyribodipyrimidine photolyase